MKNFRLLAFVIGLIAFTMVGFTTITIADKSETKFMAVQADMDLESVVINDLFIVEVCNVGYTFENNKAIYNGIYIACLQKKNINADENINYRYRPQINYNSTHKLSRDLPV